MGIGFGAVVAEKDAGRGVAIRSGDGKRARGSGRGPGDPSRRVHLAQPGRGGQGRRLRKG